MSVGAAVKAGGTNTVALGNTVAGRMAVGFSATTVATGIVAVATLGGKVNRTVGWRVADSGIAVAEPCSPLEIVSTMPKITANAMTPTAAIATITSLPMSRRTFSLRLDFERKCEVKSAANAGSAFQPNLATVRFDERPGNGQTDTRIA